MRYRFNEIFRENSDGSLTPIQQIRVGGAIFGSGVTFGSGAIFGGVNFHEYKGHDIEAEESENMIIIKGIY